MAKKTQSAAAGAFQAPPGSRHEWHDRSGAHVVIVADDGLFTPANPAELALVKRRGWPAATESSGPEPTQPDQKPAEPGGKEPDAQ